MDQKVFVPSVVKLISNQLHHVKVQSVLWRLKTPL